VASPSSVSAVWSFRSDSMSRSATSSVALVVEHSPISSMASAGISGGSIEAPALEIVSWARSNQSSQSLGLISGRSRMATSRCFGVTAGWLRSLARATARSLISSFNTNIDQLFESAVRRPPNLGSNSSSRRSAVKPTAATAMLSSSASRKSPRMICVKKSCAVVSLSSSKR
jgi:hypothetical protein